LFCRAAGPRCNLGERYQLADILIIALCTVLSGGCTAVDMAVYGRAKREFLCRFLELKHGVPSHDTFSRVFRLLDPDQFRACFQRLLADRGDDGDRVIAIDGKAARGGRSGLHMVSAWDCRRQQVLAQVAIEAKSLESAAIAELLTRLPLEGAIVTVDALNSRRSVARMIVERGGDYVLALKANHGGFYARVSRFLDDLRPHPSAIDTTVTTDHGRRETRTSLVSVDVDWLPPQHCWPGLAALGKVVRTRGPADPLAGRETIEAAYYLLSSRLSASRFTEAARAHWGVENRLHWPLNAVMNENQARSRCDNSPYNLAILRHIALNVMHKDSSPLSLRSKFNLTGWQDAFLAELLARADRDIAASAGGS
jgi:predicted transposase YbfD/YdcC